MRDDAEKMSQNNEIAKENASLTEQYESLIKEIAEKSELMDK